ncbi:hypothetical protein DPMN_153413 [Dreissena polymorpha]|uniref:Uncharacterized protein n=1 Tax=Dreissena polymorpha TaxID=45954 RepID=A0A9D4FK45_DREPO|nr:hypothetical protein DPMN_153413 [Dreissena polymorpha]
MRTSAPALPCLSQDLRLPVTEQVARRREPGRISKATFPSGSPPSYWLFHKGCIPVT